MTRHTTAGPLAVWWGGGGGKAISGGLAGEERRGGADKVDGEALVDMRWDVDDVAVDVGEVEGENKTRVKVRKG